MPVPEVAERGAVQAAPAAARRRPRGELIAWGLLVAVALALRLIDLGSRPFHHDESQDAYFSWLFQTSGDYAYDPLLHGPLRFYLTAGIYTLLGASDFTARLAPALMGTTMVALAYGLRAQLGRLAAYAAGVMLAVGPSYLYFSRFAREDIYIAAITMAMLVVTFRYFDVPRDETAASLRELIALAEELFEDLGDYNTKIGRAAKAIGATGCPVDQLNAVVRYAERVAPHFGYVALPVI